MHDPMTVAFEIKSPWPKTGMGRWKYYPAIVTVWHVDPERDAGERGTRSDDTCGWFNPPTTSAERDEIRKLGEREWSSLFGRQHAESEGASYASICYVPSTYDAIYWAWRCIKYASKKRWEYGPRFNRQALTSGELQEIYTLASSPIDNLRVSVSEVTDAETCGHFFLTVYRCFTRYHRPWYRHPRWHFWHWRFQIHPLQKLRRWLFDRCSHCGKRFGWNESPTSTWSGDKLWHSGCFPQNVKVPNAMRDELAVVQRARRPDGECLH